MRISWTFVITHSAVDVLILVCPSDCACAVIAVVIFSRERNSAKRASGQQSSSLPPIPVEAPFGTSREIQGRVAIGPTQ